MGNALGRGGRRRRVLNEEIVAASATHSAYQSSQGEGPGAQNAASYGEAAAPQNHPRISDLVARKSGTIWSGWVLAVLSVAVLVAMDSYQASLAALLGAAGMSPLKLAAPGSLASWFASIVLLLGAGHSLFIYSIRRHKLNDYKGRYRIWFWAAAVLALLSTNAITSLHASFAAAAAHTTGWTALNHHAVWWLVPGAPVCAWIVLRTLRDASESRLATFAYTCAILFFAVGLAAHLGDLTTLGLGGQLADLVPTASVLLGDVCLLAMLVAYARFVNLDAEGLVPPRTKPAAATRPTQEQRSKSPPASSKTGKPTSDQQPRSDPESLKKVIARQRDRKARQGTDSTDWVDGSQPIPDESYPDDDLSAKPRKLSKSERKRLRKQKTDKRRAA